MYRFDAAAGMRFGFDLLSGGGGNHRWRLIDPLGQVIFGPSSLSDTGLMTAAMAGTYTLLVEGYAAQSADVGYSFAFDVPARSEEHTSELQSLMRISYAVFCLKKKKQH